MIPDNWTWCGYEDTCRNCDAAAVFLSPDKAEWRCDVCGAQGENGMKQFGRKVLNVVGVAVLVLFMLGWLGWYYSTCLQDVSATLADVPAICLLVK